MKKYPYIQPFYSDRDPTEGELGIGVGTYWANYVTENLFYLTAINEIDKGYKANWELCLIPINKKLLEVELEKQNLNLKANKEEKLEILKEIKKIKKNLEADE
jgi:hypothetical protein